MKKYLLFLVAGITVISLLSIGLSTEAREFRVDEHTVALWHFNEGEGNVFYDSSPNYNDGTIYGAEWTDGKFGKALEFDGDDELKVPDSESLRLTGPLTIEAWVKTPGAFWGFQSIVAKDSWSEDESEWFGYELQISGEHWRGDGVLYMALMNETDWVEAWGSQDLRDNLWHYVAGVFNGTDVRLYVDGSLESVTPWSNTIGVATTDLEIGHWRGDLIYYWFNGVIDEVRISNIARTAEEIEAHWDYVVIGEDVAIVAEEIESLTGLTQGEQESLITKLDTALARLSDAADAYATGETNVAVNQLNATQNNLQAFINEIEAKVQSGKIDSETGNDLINQAEDLIEYIEQLKSEYSA